MEPPEEAFIEKFLTVEKIESQIIHLEKKREQLAVALRGLGSALTKTA